MLLVKFEILGLASVVYFFIVLFPNVPEKWTLPKVLSWCSTGTPVEFIKDMYRMLINKSPDDKVLLYK